MDERHDHNREEFGGGYSKDRRGYGFAGCSGHVGQYECSADWVIDKALCMAVADNMIAHLERQWNVLHAHCSSCLQFHSGE